MTTPSTATDTATSTDAPFDPTERITRAEAMRRLGVSGTTLDRYFASGLLPVVRTTIGRRTFTLAGDVERVRRARLGLDQ
jgi:DNA-binding transcriptional MerR regulator